MIPPDPGEDCLAGGHNSGWEAAREPQTRRSRANLAAIAFTDGLSLPHYFIES